MKRIPKVGIVGDSALREAAAGEYSAVMTLVRAAIRKLFPNTDIWGCAFYADRVIACHDGRLYAYPYTIDEANQVTIGSPYEVVLAHNPVSTTDAAAVAKMREAAPNSDGTAGAGAAAGDGARPVAGPDAVFLEAIDKGSAKPTRFLVRVIRSGVSRNGVLYPAAVLREAVKRFDGARVFVKSDDEHLAGKGKDVRQLVGRLVEAAYHNTTEGEGEIRAVLEALESVPVTALMREAVERGMGDIFGLSIDATGESIKRAKFKEAKSLTHVKSVDLIVEPGAGGQVMSFVEATKESDTMLRQQMLDHIAKRDKKRAEQLADASDDQVLTAYREACASESGGEGNGHGTGNGANGGGATTPDTVTREEMREALRMGNARGYARTAIGAAKLHEKSKARLSAHFDAQTSFREADVDAALKDAAELEAALTPKPAVRGLGSDSFLEARPGQDRAEKVDAMLDEFFNRDKPAISFREAYVEITGDRHVTGLFKNCDVDRLRESVRAEFREAISSSTFDDILGNAVTRAMVREYGALDAYQDYRDLVDVVPVRDFRTQERTRLGGYGNLPAVAQDAAYAALASPGDDKATYAVTKRGGIETISLETIANDDVGVIRRIPLALATAAGRTLYEFVLDFIRTNAVIYDGLALFVAGHNNLGAAALSAASFAAARLRMKRQTELSSAKRLGITLRHLYVPADLEETAFDLFVRGTNNDETFTQSRKPKVHVVDYWTDANDWFATADKGVVPLIELGFLNGQEQPEIFVQEQPTQGSLFSNDQIKLKIRHIYSGAVVDFRGFDGSIVI